MTRSATPRRGRIRALPAPAVDNWLSRAYLAVVAASLVFLLYAVYVAPDPGFAAIWPAMTTAPLSALVLMVPTPDADSSLAWLSPVILSTGMALAGLLNATLLGLLARSLRTRSPRPSV
ncbi:hypothetical protein [Streptomyces sp. CAU 1734]|uniref:SCO4225 family membrane protein n=1 Tax=Streptomyces sp. CAU 1734 TaxID=3140360 RepID=UPI0032601AE9